MAQNTALDRVNFLNIGLMVASFGLAYYFPFELFLAAYAVLGPLHYLTEISWLHDRKYFSHGRVGVVLLAACTFLATYAYTWGLGAWVSRFDPVLLAFTFSCAVAFLQNRALRIAGMAAAIGITAQLSDSIWVGVLFGVFVPTLIHVFFFTWIFVLYGSLKEKSLSGYFSLAVLTALAAACFLLPAPASFPQLSPYVQQNMRAFGNLQLDLATLLGWDFSSPAVVNAMRFIAFAYTYHYLNWLSKTRVIQWHKVGRVRFISIVALYVVFVGTYLYDYQFGLKALALLSMGHVFLEFPLNFKSVQGVGTEIYSRFRQNKSTPTKKRQKASVSSRRKTG